MVGDEKGRSHGERGEDGRGGGGDVVLEGDVSDEGLGDGEEGVRRPREQQA